MHGFAIGCDCCDGQTQPCLDAARICVAVSEPPACQVQPPTGVTITVTNSGGTVVGTCNVSATFLGASCCVSVPAEGDYTVTATYPSGPTQSATVHARCGMDTFVSFVIPHDLLSYIVLEAHGCDGWLDGATLTIGGGTSTTVAGIGNPIAVAPNGTYSGSFSGGGAAGTITNIRSGPPCSISVVRVEIVQYTDVIVASQLMPGCPCSCTVTIHGHSSGSATIPLDHRSGDTCGSIGFTRIALSPPAIISVANGLCPQPVWYTAAAANATETTVDFPSASCTAAFFLTNYPNPLC